MDHLPALQILGYQETPPHLRVLRLPEATIEPPPVRLDPADCALDRAFVRDGWIAFAPNQEVWGAPLPLGRPAFHVGRWWDCVPSPNPQRVWLANPVEPDPNSRTDRNSTTVLVEYDGVRRREVHRYELPQPLRLEAAVEEGWILRERDDGHRSVQDGMWLWPWRESGGTRVAPGSTVLDAHRSLLAVAQRDGELALVDAASKSEMPVIRPSDGRWDPFGSFSPDGASFAIGIREERDDEVADGAFLGTPSRAPAWTRLSLIDAITGAATLVGGRFDGFASAPVWSRDSTWLMFDAPFDSSLFLCDTRPTRPTLTPIVERRRRPSPLIDITGIG